MSGAGFLWMQADIRDVSWWLPHGPARDLVWLVVLVLNLLVLVYFLHKLLFRGKEWSIPQALRDRGQAIERQLREAESAHQAALARLGAIEERIARLPEEVAALEAEAEREANQEYQRLAEESRREAERVVRLGQQEMETAVKLAQKELKGVAAALALDLATQRIKERLTSELDQAVVRDALAGIGPGKAN